MALILLGWELCASSITVLCVQAVMIVGLLLCRNVLLYVGEFATRVTVHSQINPACVTSPNLVKYGFAAILDPFIKDVNKLANV